MKNTHVLLQLEYRRIADIEFYERRLRKQNYKIVSQMRASIREFGFKIPVLIHGKKLIDGRLRIEAAIAEGYTEIPVILCDDWTEATVKAFRLMANRSASWATFDLDLVSLEIQELHAEGFKLSLTGLDGFEIDQFLFGKPELDQVPAEPLIDVSRLGDLWLMDLHRVLCSDSTQVESVSFLLGSAKPVLMVTDPPCGVSMKPWRELAGLGRQRQTGTIPNDDRVDWSLAYKLFPGDVAYVWHAGVHAAEVAANLESAGFVLRGQIIWAKQQFA